MSQQYGGDANLYSQVNVDGLKRPLERTTFNQSNGCTTNGGLCATAAACRTSTTPPNFDALAARNAQVDHTMPPHKRGRYQSPNSQARSPPTKDNMSRSHHFNSTATTLPTPQDVPKLLEALQNYAAAKFPQATHLIQALYDILLPQSNLEKNWPYSSINNTQQMYVKEGQMALDSTTNRWKVNLCPLLMASNPHLFDSTVLQGLSSPSVVPTAVPDIATHDPIHDRIISTATTSTNTVNQSSTGGIDDSVSYIQNQRAAVADSAMELQRRAENMSNGSQLSTNVPGSSGSTNMDVTMSVNSPSSIQGSNPAVSNGSKGSSSGGSQQQQQQQMATTGATPPSNSSNKEEQPWWMKLQSIPPVSEQERVVVWSGILARNDKKKTPATLRRLCGPVEQFLPMDGLLSISHRSAYEELSKKDVGAVAIMESASADSLKIFQEYIQYFHEKNRAGVIRIEKNEFEMIYLMPGNVVGVANALGDLLPKNSDDILVAIVGRACRNATLP